jgi:hypothetical protein
MIKPASLRAAIAAAVPDLDANPDKFLVFADAGTTVASGARSLSFEYRYTLNLILLDFAGDADVVMMALLSWVRRHQSDLVNNPEKRASAITFEVDHLNNATCDLSIKLPLTEAIKVTQGEDGTLSATHLEEPVPEWETKGLAG